MESDSDGSDSELVSGCADVSADAAPLPSESGVCSEKKNNTFD